MVLIRTTTFFRLKQERAGIEVQVDRLQSGSLSVMRQAADDREVFITSIRTATRYQLREADRRIDAEHGRLVSLADQVVCDAGLQMKGAIETVVHRAQLQLGERVAAIEKAASIVSFKSEAAIESAVSDLDHSLAGVRRGSLAMVEDASSKVGAHIRLVVGLGPQSTLQRGFSIAKNPDGRPITSRAEATLNAEFTVQFHDGTVQVSNKEFEGGNEP
jgi:exodeoxyribonuclease VII large subunit